MFTLFDNSKWHSTRAGAFEAPDQARVGSVSKWYWCQIFQALCVFCMQIEKGEYQPRWKQSSSSSSSMHTLCFASAYWCDPQMVMGKARALARGVGAIQGEWPSGTFLPATISHHDAAAQCASQIQTEYNTKYKYLWEFGQKYVFSTFEVLVPQPT